MASVVISRADVTIRYLRPQLLVSLLRSPHAARSLARRRDGKVVCTPAEQSSVSNIYAIGDVVSGKPELTPVAIQAGRLLARRLVNEASILTDYTNVATTVFTPMEYGCIGLSEEDAVAQFGEDDIEVYHQFFTALEHTVAQRDENGCYAKLVCRISQDVSGFVRRRVSESG